MIKERKEFRKSFYSYGQLYIAGEKLDFMSYDISLTGILVEIEPGNYLTDINDFNAFIKENDTAEIFIKDIMVTGEATLSWAKPKNGKIMLGMEFKNVMYNAEDLWRKRYYYRRKMIFSGYLIVNTKRFDFAGIDASVDGLAIQFTELDKELNSGNVIKLFVKSLDINALGKIIWVENEEQENLKLGLRYLSMK